MQQGYYSAPAAPPAIQHQTNVVVVNQQQPIPRPAVVYRSESKPQVNHMLHLLITVFIFPPWVFVWIALWIMYGE